tara:strand:- start:1817 stop:2029 length:213 start_codon:yes stop_codon:yes gene_type:complete
LRESHLLIKGKLKANQSSSKTAKVFTGLAHPVELKRAEERARLDTAGVYPSPQMDHRHSAEMPVIFVVTL